MKKLAGNILRFIDIPRHLSNHVIGRNHSIQHRQGFGFAVMVIGVTMAHTGGHLISNVPVYIAVDLLGYGLHGIGLLPFISNLEEKANKTSNS